MSNPQAAHCLEAVRSIKEHDRGGEVDWNKLVPPMNHTLASHDLHAILEAAPLLLEDLIWRGLLYALRTERERSASDHQRGTWRSSRNSSQKPPQLLPGQCSHPCLATVARLGWLGSAAVSVWHSQALGLAPAAPAWPVECGRALPPSFQGRKQEQRKHVVPVHS